MIERDQKLRPVVATQKAMYDEKRESDEIPSFPYPKIVPSSAPAIRQIPQHSRKRLSVFPYCK